MSVYFSYLDHSVLLLSGSVSHDRSPRVAAGPDGLLTLARLCRHRSDFARLGGLFAAFPRGRILWRPHAIFANDLGSVRELLSERRVGFFLANLPIVLLNLVQDENLI